MAMEGGDGRFQSDRDGEGPLAVIGPTGDVLARIADAEGLLTAAECRRASEFRRDEDRQDFIAAHALVRSCAARLLGTAMASLTVAQCCPTCGGPHGKPAIAGFPGLHVSLAHSRGVVAAAAGFGPIGIDVEALGGRPVSAGELDSVLAPREILAQARAGNDQLALLRQWVRKEALVKIGVATLTTLSSVDLADLPLDGEGSNGQARNHGWNGLFLLDWLDVRMGAIGTVVAAMPVRLETWARAIGGGVLGSVQRPGSYR